MPYTLQGTNNLCKGFAYFNSSKISKFFYKVILLNVPYLILCPI